MTLTLIRRKLIPHGRTIARRNLRRGLLRSIWTRPTLSLFRRISPQANPESDESSGIYNRVIELCVGCDVFGLLPWSCAVEGCSAREADDDAETYSHLWPRLRTAPVRLPPPSWRKCSPLTWANHGQEGVIMRLNRRFTR